MLIYAVILIYPLPHTFGFFFSHSVSPSFEIAQTMLMTDSYIENYSIFARCMTTRPKGTKIKRGKYFPAYTVYWNLSSIFCKNGYWFVATIIAASTHVQDIYIRDRYMKILATFFLIANKSWLNLLLLKLFSFQCIFQLWVYLILHNCVEAVAEVR